MGPLLQSQRSGLSRELRLRSEGQRGPGGWGELDPLGCGAPASSLGGCVLQQSWGQVAGPPSLAHPGLSP